MYESSYFNTILESFVSRKHASDEFLAVAWINMLERIRAFAISVTLDHVAPNAQHVNIFYLVHISFFGDAIDSSCMIKIDKIDKVFDDSFPGLIHRRTAGGCTCTASSRGSGEKTCVMRIPWSTKQLPRKVRPRTVPLRAPHPSLRLIGQVLVVSSLIGSGWVLSRRRDQTARKTRSTVEQA